MSVRSWEIGFVWLVLVNIPQSRFKVTVQVGVTAAEGMRAVDDVDGW